MILYFIPQSPAVIEKQIGQQVNYSSVWFRGHRRVGFQLGGRGPCRVGPWKASCQVSALRARRHLSSLALLKGCAFQAMFPRRSLPHLVVSPGGLCEGRVTGASTVGAMTSSGLCSEAKKIHSDGEAAFRRPCGSGCRCREDRQTGRSKWWGRKSHPFSCH